MRDENSKRVYFGLYYFAKLRNTIFQLYTKRLHKIYNQIFLLRNDEISKFYHIDCHCHEIRPCFVEEMGTATILSVQYVC